MRLNDGLYIFGASVLESNHHPTVITYFHQQASIRRTVQPVNQSTCRVKSSCDVQGNFQAYRIYKVIVKTNRKYATYIVDAQTTLIGVTAHKNSYNYEKHMNTTDLSSYVWENDLNPAPDIEWEIIRTAQLYKP